MAAVNTVNELVDAVNNGAANDTVQIAAGTFELTAPLRPKPGMKIVGAGAGKTIVKNASSWAPGNAGLDSDEGAQLSGIRCDSYLVSLPEKTTDLSISDLTLTGPQMHGAICGILPNGLQLARLEFRQFLWSGVRAFILENAHIHDNVFIDAGGKSGVTTGSSGGGLFLTYVSKTEINNNRFSVTPGRPGDYYGIKGREARNVRIHHNTIATDFAIEFPFEGDWLVDVEYNYLGGTISVPKYGGGPIPDGGYTFHVHHNAFTTSYAFEYQRNGVEIDHNLFDFKTDADYGNLISSFDSVPAEPGGTKMHNNRISNPGRGIFWNEGVYNSFLFYNNHVIGRTTVTPRTEGLFDFRSDRMGGVAKWNSIQIRDNIIELEGTARPLMRNADSYAAAIENNTFKNISDTASYANASKDRPRGLLAPLCFRLGADDEWAVDEWKLLKNPPQGICGADAGTTDAGGVDSGFPGPGSDAGTTDPKPSDKDSGTATADAGVALPPGGTSGAGCGGCGTGSTATSPLLWLFLVAATFALRRYRR